MMFRTGRIARIPRAMVATWLLAGCGSYDNGSKNPPGSGGSVSTAGTATGGAKATGGSLSTAGTSAGGTTPAGGTGTATGGTSNPPAGGTGGQAPSGGSGGGGGASGGASGGGGNGKASCADAAKAPCGGDIVGAWASASCEITISGVADMVPTGLGCKTAPITGSFKVSGTWTATADGKFEDKTTTTGQATLILEKSCLTISGFATTCDRIPLDPLGLPTVACVDDAATQGCTCTATINQSGGMGAPSLQATFNGPDGGKGTYTTADNKVITSIEDVPTEYSYCVAGNTMTMNLTTVSPVGTLTGPIVLQKQ